MDEKQPLIPQDQRTDVTVGSMDPSRGSMTTTRQRPIRRVLSVLLLTLMLWLLVKSCIFMFSYSQEKSSSRGGEYEKELEQDSISTRNITRIPLEAHIMSKCPDARDCLRKLIVPTMEKVVDKVDFQLSFIGSVDAHSDEVSCKHGPGECLGNIIILCAAKLYPDPKTNLGFANCLISDYQQIPQRELVEDCAMDHGLSFERVNDCISDEGHGVDLLRDSVTRSASNEVTKSCTVRVDGHVRCIRDGGEWYDCDGGSSVKDLVGDIERLYDRVNRQ